jgi:hypothetical protein
VLRTNKSITIWPFDLKECMPQGFYWRRFKAPTVANGARHLRAFLTALCLLAILGLGRTADAASAENYLVGAVYKSFVTAFYDRSNKVLYDIPIPEGDWQLVAQRIRKSKSGELFQDLLLVHLNGTKMDGYVRINFYPHSYYGRWSDEPCAGAHLYANDFGKKLWSKKCLTIDPHIYAFSSDEELNQQAQDYLHKRQIGWRLPSLAMSYFQLGDSGKYLSVHYGVFVEELGLGIPVSPWSESIVSADPQKTELLHAFSRYANVYADLIEKSYNQNRFRNTLGFFSRVAQEGTQAVAQTSAPPLVLSPSVRRALVIGNNRYLHVPALTNAVADAKALAAMLGRYGYAVSLHTDVPEKRMKAALRNFKNTVQEGDEVAVFYAGHGVQLGAANYLLPVDVVRNNAEQVKDEAIALQKILDDMGERKAKLTLAVIDACRDNPFPGFGRGIDSNSQRPAPTSLATGQMVVFSAGAGQQALDRLGPSDTHKNSLFTRVFLVEMQKPGVGIDKMVRNVRMEVFTQAKAVGHEQVPAIYDQVVGDFFFSR